MLMDRRSLSGPTWRFRRLAEARSVAEREGQVACNRGLYRLNEPDNAHPTERRLIFWPQGAAPLFPEDQTQGLCVLSRLAGWLVTMSFTCRINLPEV